jgi:hypothetical protein
MRNTGNSAYLVVLPKGNLVFFQMLMRLFGTFPPEADATNPASQM